MKIIGLTGGIGSGKSVVLSVFSSFGVPCYESDNRAKKLMHEDLELIHQIKALFGDEIYENDKLNRSKLADLVFADKSKLERLNALVHPRVKKDFQSFVDQQDAVYVIKETAILFETGAAKDCDATILVTAPEKLRTERVMKREKTNAAHIKSRMNNQWSDEKKIQLADYVINNIDWDKTLKKIDEIHQKLLIL
ncbi:MAG: dephospho-CoA kinase [Flavobacteriaceae bacterium TMED42]|nr:MAG: dephospho-CoA kinase [Flavobacteriaceae bacterium TMED42]|tara:strand:+ start:5761 stop:6342 length:582 start_codon:yes stop_codon:yes gene_type:complete